MKKKKKNANQNTKVRVIIEMLSNSSYNIIIMHTQSTTIQSEIQIILDDDDDDDRPLNLVGRVFSSMAYALLRYNDF